MKPVDIYVRSSRVASEHYMADADQEREARKFAESKGLAVGRVLADKNYSGGTLDRPALQEALRRVEDGKSGGIVVAYLSRLSRDTSQGLELLKQVAEAGGTVYAPNLPDSMTADGKMLTTMQLAVDAGYRERKREELERAKENAIALGIPVHTRPAVGYRQRSDRRLEPDPRVAPIVREVFERRAQGEGPAALGRFLESRKVRTSQGSWTWSKQAVYNLLSNRVYLGELSYGKDRRFVNPAAHEPIVDLETFLAAQHPNGRKLAPARSKDSEFLLTGIVRCAGCRHCLQATTTSRGKRIYRCQRTHAGGVCQSPASVAAEPVETVAVEAFWTLTSDLEAEGQEDTSGDLARLETALERAENALQGWTSVEMQEAIGGLAEYAEGLRIRSEARDAAAQELGAARAESAGSRTLPDTDTLRSAWKRMTAQERREVLALRFDCLALQRDGTVVVYPAGAGPADLPRRGFKRSPILAAFPDPPDGARTLTLFEPLEKAS